MRILSIWWACGDPELNKSWKWMLAHYSEAGWICIPLAFLTHWPPQQQSNGQNFDRKRA